LHSLRFARFGEAGPHPTKTMAPFGGQVGWLLFEDQSKREKDEREWNTIGGNKTIHCDGLWCAYFFARDDRYVILMCQLFSAVWRSSVR